MFGRSAILALVLQLLLGLAKDQLDDPALKLRVKKYVEDVVPGTWLDAVAWGLVDVVWEILLAYAKANSGDVSPKAVALGVEECRGAACEYLEKAA